MSGRPVDTKATSAPGAPGSPSKGAVKGAVKGVAKGAAKGTAKGTAKGAAKGTAKGVAKGVAIRPASNPAPKTASGPAPGTVPDRARKPASKPAPGAAPKAAPKAAPRSAQTATSRPDPAPLRRFKPGSPDFHRADFPFYWIARVYAVYTLDMERTLGAVGRDIPTWRVLAILAEQGTSSVSEIATHAIAKLSTVTRIVYRMRDEGLVTVATAAHDGRVTEVTMTAAGQRAMQRINEATQSLWVRSFAGLSAAKVARLNALLMELFDNLAR